MPPYTDAVPLAFDDVPFRTEDFHDKSGKRRTCAICEANDSFLDELIDDNGCKSWQCSDADYCRDQLQSTRNSRVERA